MSTGYFNFPLFGGAVAKNKSYSKNFFQKTDNIPFCYAS